MGQPLKMSFISASPASCPSRRHRETVRESKNVGKLIAVLLPSSAALSIANISTSGYYILSFFG